MAYADTVIDGDIIVNDTDPGTGAAEAFIVKADLGTLTGGAGGDVFVFIDPANKVGLISDFDSSEGDFLVISASGFDVDIAEGSLDGSGNFLSGPGATAGDVGEYFLFDTSLNRLYFDPDGNTPGGEDPVLIATFDVDLTANYIFIIA